MKRVYEALGLALFCMFILSINGINFAAVFIVATTVIIYMSIIINRMSKKYSNKYLNIIKNIINVIVSAFILSFIIIESMIVLDMLNVKEVKDIEKVDYILVLGAGLDGENVGITLKSRLDKALEYYKYNKDSILIVSGGQGDDEVISEAEAMYRYLIEKGVDSNNIIKEDKATTTLENMIFTKDILRDRNNEKEKILIVTNDFHLFRSKTIANLLGMTNVGLASSTPLKVRINYLFREYPTLIIDVVRTSAKSLSY